MFRRMTEVRNNTLFEWTPSYSYIDVYRHPSLEFVQTIQVGTNKPDEATFKAAIEMYFDRD